MPDLIEIDGGVATLITKTIVRKVPTSEVLKLVERVPPVILPTIARSQVFGYWHELNSRDKRLYALCELQPGVRSITKAVRPPDGGRRIMKRYKLSMPWTYFWFVAQTNDPDYASAVNWAILSTRVFYAKDQYQDVNSSLIVAPLPNLSSNGEVCWGSTGANRGQSLANQLDQRVAEWYLSDFNDDLDGGIQYPYGERNMKRWVEESKESTTSWRDWTEFTQPNRIITVKKLIEQQGVPVPIGERFNTDGFIPPIELPMTYGRWDEFWMSIPEEQRLRGLTSLNNLREDNPDLVPETLNIPEEIVVDRNDDGGIVV